MAENSKIEWTTHTFNPWRGCTKVSPGCANCYAEALSKRNPSVLGVWGPNGKRVIAAESAWREPIKWNAAAALAGERHRVFCASLADVFEGDDTMPAESVPVVWAARRRLFALIAMTPYLDWLLLTKRPQNITPTIERLRGDNVVATGNWPWRNVWLGTSVENQTAMRRLDALKAVRATVHFLSCEPLLGPLGFTDGPANPEESTMGSWSELDGIDWVIVGGESGPGARNFRVEWARSIIDQCKAANVACFVKQLGSRPTTTLPALERWPGHDGPTSRVQFSGDGFGNYHVSGLNDRKGGDMDEWPADLRVRQLPEVAHAQA